MALEFCAVLVSVGSVTIPQSSGLSSRHLFPPFLEAGKLKIRVSAGLMSGAGALLSVASHEESVREKQLAR